MFVIIFLMALSHFWTPSDPEMEWVKTQISTPITDSASFIAAKEVFSDSPASISNDTLSTPDVTFRDSGYFPGLQSDSINDRQVFKAAFNDFLLIQMAFILACFMVGFIILKYLLNREFKSSGQEKCCPGKEMDRVTGLAGTNQPPTLTTIRESLNPKLNQCSDQMSPITQATIPVQPCRRIQSPYLETHELLHQLFSQVDGHRDSLDGFSPSRGRWEMGFNTLKGNVRNENQDYCLGFSLDRYQAMLIADGLGGLKYGRRASFMATWAAAVSLIQNLRKGGHPFRMAPQTLAAEAMQAAHLCLATEGDKMNVFQEGLRTTLIIIVADRTTIGYAYIGDGGACIIRQSGKIIHFLEPQKAFKNVMNVLAASLGPSLHGKPVIGSIARQPGDLLVVGTDGVFDRLEERPELFPEGTNRFLSCLRQRAVNYDGDLQRVVDQALEEMASYKDQAGYICDDNLTLGLLGDGIGPACDCYAPKDASVIGEACN